MNGSKFKTGECWSTLVGASETPITVILLDCSSTLMAVPLFADDSMSGSNDVLIEPAPDFFLDERWAACSEMIEISSDRLFRRLGKLDWEIVAEIKKACSGEPGCRLERGELLIHGIGDPREAFHKAFIKQVRRNAGVSFLEILFNPFLRKLEMGEGCLDCRIDTIFSAASPLPFRDVNSDCTPQIVFLGKNGKRIVIEVDTTLNHCFLTVRLYVDDASAISFHGGDNGTIYPLCEVDTSCWCWIGEPLPMQNYTVFLEYPGGAHENFALFMRQNDN